MDPGKKKERQTNIIDDQAAIALAMQGGRRKAQPKKKKSGGVGPSGPQTASSSKSKSTKKASTSKATDAQYYEKDGLKIPLYDKGGKKKTNARLSLTLRNKNLDHLLDMSTPARKRRSNSRMPTRPRPISRIGSRQRRRALFLLTQKASCQLQRQRKITKLTQRILCGMRYRQQKPTKARAKAKHRYRIKVC